MIEKSLDYYIELFQNFKVDTASLKKNRFAAPHQPILALSLIQSFDRGLYTDEKIYLTPELVDIFTTNWSLLVNNGNYHPLIAQPFCHIKSKVKKKVIKWWWLVPKPGCEIWLENAGYMHSFRNLSNAIDHAEIDLELSVILSVAENRNKLRHAILQKYFSENVGVDLHIVGEHFDQISGEILNETPAIYAANIRQMKERMSGDSKQRELFQQEIYIRGGAFKRDVPKYYNYTCCISGLKVDATINVSMIDACHIVPFSKSYNDTITNGIALCPNLHRAFDRGLIAIDDNLQVLVSERFVESINTIYSVKRLAGMSIFLPDEPRFQPLSENFAWHRKHTFKP